jgi:hypothetical protein
MLLDEIDKMGADVRGHGTGDSKRCGSLDGLDAQTPDHACHPCRSRHIASIPGHLFNLLAIVNLLVFLMSFH